MPIPIAKTLFGPEELRAIQRPLVSGWVVQGPYVQEFEHKFSAYTGAGHAIATINCTTALQIAVTALGLTVISNQLSRAVENRADVYSLELTNQARAFIELERRLALANVSDPDPPDAYHFVFGTHPTTVKRIGIGRAFQGRAAE